MNHILINKIIILQVELTLKQMMNCEENIMKKITKLVGKNYKNNNGYLKQINKIEKINSEKIKKNDFNGNIICDVSVNVDFINPKINDVIECIIKENNNIIIGINDILKIVIVDQNLNLNIGDKVKVKVLAKQIKYNNNYINIVGSINI
jgi:hypothetical protein